MGKFEDLFWNNVLSKETKSCWLWSGTKNRSGYGVFFTEGNNHLAHRLAYKIVKGKIPEGKYVLHSCDNPPCVNPDHLRIGDAWDNAQDRRKRFVSKNGVDCFMKKLNRALIHLRIRWLEENHLSARKVSDATGIDYNTVNRWFSVGRTPHGLYRERVIKIFKTFPLEVV